MKCLIILMFFTGCYIRKEPLPPVYDIVLCVGQSNMVGKGTIEAQDSNSQAWLWNNSGWEKADGYVNRYSNIIPYQGNTLSLTNSFGKEAAKRHRHPYTGLVANSREATTVYDWNHGLIGYGITRANAALTANPGSKISAVLYHQGESDALNNSATWLSEFAGIRAQIDSGLGYNVPILVGGISNDIAYYIPMNAIIAQCESLHDCYFISSVGLTTFDTVHFDSASCREFGLRYYAKYEQVKL